MINTALTALGPYRLESVVGRGAFAVVHAAVDTRDGRSMALKVLSPFFSNDANFVRNFFGEQQTVAALTHPNIVRIYDAGEEHGHCYLAMELIHGESLAARMAAVRGPLPVDEVLRIVKGVASALDYAHDKGVLHHDIKPGNILLADDGRVVLTDFAMAHATSEPLAEATLTGISLGTPTYMSPEQVRGEPQDGRSDTYSLAIVTYTMLTGFQPFQRTNLAAVLRAVTETAPADLSLVAPDVPTGMARAVQRGLAKPPADRFATAGQFADALERGAAGEDVLEEAEHAAPRTFAQPQQRGRMLWNWVMVAILLPLVLASLVGNYVWPWLVERARNTDPTAEATVDVAAAPPTHTRRPTYTATASATADLQAIAARLATPTAPATPAPGQSATFRWLHAPSLAEDFSKPGSYWPTLSNETAWWRPEDYGYHLTVRRPGTAALLKLPIDVGDFSMVVTGRSVTARAGEHFGLVWRTQSDGYYQLDYAVEGTYELAKVLRATRTVLASGAAPVSVAGAAARRELQVTVVGDTMEVAIDGVAMSRYQDVELARGAPGLYGSSAAEAAEFVFDDFRLEPAESEAESVVLKPYDDPAGRYSLHLPATWAADSDGAMLVAQPDAGDVRVMVVSLETLDHDYELTELASLVLEVGQGLYRNLAISAQGPDAVDGLAAYAMELHADVAGRAVSGQLLTVKQDDTAYALWILADAAKEPLMRPLLLYVRNSFRLHPAPTATPIPILSSTPTPSHTPIPTATKTTPAPIASPNAPPVRPGVILDFETPATWRTGQQPHGTLTRTTRGAVSGAYAGLLTYNIPATADNYVVLLRQPPVAIPGAPEALTIQVYGDGSEGFLNAWVQDSAGEVRQFTFGQVFHKDTWQPMTLVLDTGADWPQQNISGADNDRLDYPIRLYALVYDAIREDMAHKGQILLDDLAGGEAPAPDDAGAEGDTAPTTELAARASPEPAQPVARTGHIAYAGWSSGRSGIYLLDVATGNVRQMPVTGRQPDIRSDGRVILDGVGSGKDNLQVIDFDGANLRAASMHPEDSYPHWSPSGQSLVFHSALQGDGVDRLYIQWTGGVATELGPVKVNDVPIMGRYATWLPNWRIAYSGCDYWARGSGCGIWTIDTKSGAGPLQLTERIDDVSNDASGNSLLYSSQASGNWDIYAIPVGGGAASNLTNSRSQEVGATFSPDGASIAFISDRDGAWGIWMMNADGSNQVRLLSVPGGFGGQWWTERLSWGR